nr:MAG TPA: hypothetical protein [Caudoviricetes sp.]
MVHAKFVAYCCVLLHIFLISTLWKLLKSSLDFYNFLLYYRNKSSRTVVLSTTEQLFLVK